jgi:precorrin-6A/cobalt-precorrin-6A reductase
MILLLGGTSDAGPIALQLAERGHRVLVSQATDVPLAMPPHPGIETRRGPLDAAGLAELVARRGVAAIVDAAHPYAERLHAAAAAAARQTGVPLVAYLRPGLAESDLQALQLAADHAAAAHAAFAHGRTVLLTVGAGNLAPYVARSRATGVPLVARVLDRPESRAACRRAGIPAAGIIAGRGPFGVEENRRHIRQFQVGVLVAKDSGRAGGTAEKLEAARLEGCRVILLGRPRPALAQSFDTVESLVQAVDEIAARRM